MAIAGASEYVRVMVSSWGEEDLVRAGSKQQKLSTVKLDDYQTDDTHGPNGIGGK